MNTEDFQGVQRICRRVICARFGICLWVAGACNRKDHLGWITEGLTGLTRGWFLHECSESLKQGSLGTSVLSDAAVIPFIEQF